VFSNNTLDTKIEARDSCNTLGGFLAAIADENTQNITSAILNEYYINKTWINQSGMNKKPTDIKFWTRYRYL